MEPQAELQKVQQPNLRQRHHHHHQQQQQQQQEQEEETIPFVLRVPANQATFFSLELVEELLRYAREVKKTCGLFELPLPASRESIRVLSQIVQESEYEECWPKGHHELTNERRCAPLASYLLRIGMLRALGLPEPGLGVATGDAFLSLGREIVAFSSSNGDTEADSVWYREATQEDLRHLALGEWCEDLIFFTLSRGFSAIQAQCVLLTAMHLVNAVAELPADATDEDVERRCSQILGDLLVEQACGLPNKVVEVHKVVHTVNTNVPDPEYVAAIEARMAKENSTKQQRLLRDQLAKAPLVNQTRCEVHEKKVLAEMLVGPYFTLQEVTQILECFSLSVVQHWRLFRAFLSEMQPVETHEVSLPQWDAQKFCVPPLVEFLRDDVHSMELERCSLMNACERVMNESFDEEFVQPVSELQRQWDDLLEGWREHLRQSEEENIRNTLSAAECLRVARAFALRLNKCMERNEELGKVLNDTALSPLPASPSSSTPNAKRKSIRGNASSARSKGLKNGSSSSSSPRPPSSKSVVLATPPLAESLMPIDSPARAVFSLEEVEGRVTRLEDAVQAAQSSSSEKHKRR